MKGKFQMGYITFLVLLFAIMYFRPTDSTDKSRWKRSGMSLYIDHGTGLQYIKGGMFGPMIPRLDRNGNHMEGIK